MNVSLTPELEKYIQGKVEGGRYTSASEVVREALRLLEQKDQEREAELKEFRAKLDEGWQNSIAANGLTGRSSLRI